MPAIWPAAPTVRRTAPTRSPRATAAPGEGADSLLEGLARAETGAGRLADGTTEAREGSEQLATGSARLRDGLNNELAPGADTLATGLRAGAGAPERAAAARAATEDQLRALNTRSTR